MKDCVLRYEIGVRYSFEHGLEFVVRGEDPSKDRTYPTLALALKFMSQEVNAALFQCYRPF